MRVSHRARRNRRVVIIVLAVSAAVSAVFGYRVAPPGSPPILSALLGVANAVAVATPIVLFELYRARWAVTRRLRHLPLLAYLAVKVTYYLACIVGGTVLVWLIFEGLMGPSSSTASWPTPSSSGRPW